jgi:hypothetical protein
MGEVDPPAAQPGENRRPLSKPGLARGDMASSVPWPATGTGSVRRTWRVTNKNHAG